LTLTFDLES